MYDKLVERTGELCKAAEYHGVKLAIEVEPNQLFHNLKSFFDVAEKVNSPALKLNFDVGHMYLSEVDLEQAIDRAKDFIVYSHIDNMCMGAVSYTHLSNRSFIIFLYNSHEKTQRIVTDIRRPFLP